MQGGAADHEVVSQANAALNLCFDHLANELGNNDFLVGSTLTLADIPYVSWGPPVSQAECRYSASSA